MEPIHQMLMPEEDVLYEAHVHPIILVPGLALLGLALMMLYCFWNIGPLEGPLTVIGKSFDSMPIRYVFLRSNLAISRHPETVRAIITCCLCFSVILLAKAFLTIFFTNMVITEERIILRQGVYNISLVEIDRRRVASVNIFQTYMGRLMDYGNVTIQGFAASIHGLPVLTKPYELSKHIYGRRS